MRSASTLARRAGVAVAAAAIAAVGVIAAPSASAADLGTFSEDCDTGGTQYVSVTAAPGDTFTMTNTSGSTACTVNDPSHVVSGASTITVANAPETYTINAVPNGTYVVKIGNANSGYTHGVWLTITVASGPVPFLAKMTLSLGEGAGAAVCAGGAPSGYTGTWMTLPGQSDCSLPSRPTAKLLGWATTSSFPVAIAQRQADRGWGAYQLTNDAGEVTAIFIPAGHETFVSGSNNLYPIWAN